MKRTNTKTDEADEHNSINCPIICDDMVKLKRTLKEK